MLSLRTLWQNDRHNDKIVSVGLWLNINGLIALSWAIGLAYALFSPSRFVSPAYDAARDWMPIRYWGILIICLGTGLMVSRAKRMFLGTMLALNSGFYLFWAFMFLFAWIQSSAQHTPAPAPTAVAIYCFVAWSHFASAQSLARGTRP